MEGVLEILELERRAPLFVTLLPALLSWVVCVAALPAAALLEVLLLTAEVPLVALEAEVEEEDLLVGVCTEVEGVAEEEELLEDELEVVLLDAELEEEDLLVGVCTEVEGVAEEEELLEDELEVVLLDAELEEEDLLVGVCDVLVEAGDLLAELEEDLDTVEEDLVEDELDLVAEEDLLEEELPTEELLLVVPEEDELLLAWAQPSPEEATMAIARDDAKRILKMFFMSVCFRCHQYM